MKALAILGAIVGFLIGCGFGLAGDSPWPTTLWRACAAALLAAFLTRWWSRLWLTNLHDAINNSRPNRNKPSADKKAGLKV